MRKIVEYPCTFDGEFTIEMYPGTLLGVHSGGLTGVVLVVDADYEGNIINKTFILRRSEESILSTDDIYIGSIRHVDPYPPNMPILFHLFEIVSIY